MEHDTDSDFTAQHWEALKLLRTPQSSGRGMNPRLLGELYVAGLISFANGGHSLTPKGRSVLISGSPKLWDVAA